MKVGRCQTLLCSSSPVVMLRLGFCLCLVAAVHAQQSFLTQPLVTQQQQPLAQQQLSLAQQDSLLLQDPLLLQQGSLSLQQRPLLQGSLSVQDTLGLQQDQRLALQDPLLIGQTSLGKAALPQLQTFEQQRQQELARLRLLRRQEEALRQRQAQLQRAQILQTQTQLEQAQLLQNEAQLLQTRTRLQESPSQPQGQRIGRPSIPILEDNRDGPFQDGTYYFTYTAPNGELIIMEYIADENGYRAFPVRPGRPSQVPRPQRIPVPPPYRPPLPQFLPQALRGQSNTSRRNNRPEGKNLEQSSGSEEDFDFGPG
ncbi:Reticulocyte-binding protein 2-like 10 [Homarus americanus]|uniref:Reticulocyte-binding protein 2-like 10 n=1 Tax=Homarus americanus TaxID=6706 RepID=A0A8J5JUZ9_HOMAM|nr:Reticulocyte-binding protein 2-like 10 [Homarus americanus]